MQQSTKNLLPLSAERNVKTGSTYHYVSTKLHGITSRKSTIFTAIFKEFKVSQLLALQGG
jgi:hypothetical protein